MYHSKRHEYSGNQKGREVGREGEGREREIKK